MLLPKIPASLADPTASSWGAPLGCVSLVTFFAQAKKVTRATRETLLLLCTSKSQSKIKMDPSLRWDDGSFVEGLLGNMHAMPFLLFRA